MSLRLIPWLAAGNSPPLAITNPLPRLCGGKGRVRGVRWERVPLRGPDLHAGKIMAQDHWLLNRARQLRREQAPAEALLWSKLRDRRFEGFKFRRQTPIRE